ncbi:MAG: M48 family metalloprotease [Gammaproteobacteria bacterium]|nr:M48 family metalloprotease [Gammaproteobacteria bacterium]
MNVMSEHVPAILRYLGDHAVRALILAVVAAVILRILRVKRASLLLGVWTGVLYAAFAVPLLGTLLPALPLSVPLAESALTDSAAALVSSPVDSVPARVPATLGAPAQRHSTSWPLVALAAYTAVSCLLAGRLALGLMLGRRLSRGSLPICDVAVRLALAAQARALGLERRVRLAESAAVTVPLTVGVLDPAVLLPGDWRAWEASKLAAVLAHELAHVKRRDALTRLVSGAYRCLFWFSPLPWWLDRHLAELAEQASDQEAIVAGADPAHYAEVLMGFFAAISQVRGRVRLEGISMAHGSLASRRIENVLSMPTVAPPGIRRSLLVLLTAGAVAVTALVAAVRPVLADTTSPVSTWTFTHGDGMDFAIVSAGQGMIMNGSEDDRNAAESLKSRIHGDFIWFVHDGSSYVIRDAATVKTARRLYQPMEALDRRQVALGKQQEALGKQQEELGRRMEAVSVKMPVDLEARLKSLESTARSLGQTGSQQQLTELQDQIGHLQSEIGAVQSNAGAAQSVLGRQQGELGRRQGELGRRQGDLGRQQGDLAREASRKMQQILQQALSKGVAQRV